MEGAGSCAEVNLRSRDFVNFRMAHAAGAPVILVADIDRGGVFGQIIGTLAVIPEEDRRSVAGLIINRFRGDASLFDDGIAYLERETGLPVLGLVPFFYHIEIDSEDGLPLDTVVDPPRQPEPGKINVAVLRFPHISNFTDFAPLERDPQVTLHYLARPRPLQGYDLLLLPGSKNVRADTDWLRMLGWEPLIRGFRTDGRIGGICGGYQMLGERILDPHGVEGDPGQTRGLGLLPVETTLHKQKQTCLSKGTWVANGEPVEGYEIHMGETRSLSDAAPAMTVTSREGSYADTAGHDVPPTDGVRSADGRIWGTYLHGLFDTPQFRCAFLTELKPGYAQCRRAGEYVPTFREKQYDLLAEHFEQHLDMAQLMAIAGLP
jgi:adenosylcobyric acid synthase